MSRQPWISSASVHKISISVIICVRSPVFFRTVVRSCIDPLSFSAAQRFFVILS